MNFSLQNVKVQLFSSALAANNHSEPLSKGRVAYACTIAKAFKDLDRLSASNTRKVPGGTKETPKKRKNEKRIAKRALIRTLFGTQPEAAKVPYSQLERRIAKFALQESVRSYVIGPRSHAEDTSGEAHPRELIPETAASRFDQNEMDAAIARDSRGPTAPLGASTTNSLARGLTVAALAKAGGVDISRERLVASALNTGAIVAGTSAATAGATTVGLAGSSVVLAGGSTSSIAAGLTLITAGSAGAVGSTITGLSSIGLAGASALVAATGIGLPVGVAGGAVGLAGAGTSAAALTGSVTAVGAGTALIAGGVVGLGSSAALGATSVVTGAATAGLGLLSRSLRLGASVPTMRANLLAYQRAQALLMVEPPSEDAPRLREAQLNAGSRILREGGA